MILESNLGLSNPLFNKYRFLNPTTQRTTTWMEATQLGEGQEEVTQGDIGQVTSLAGSTSDQKFDSTVKLGLINGRRSRLIELCHQVWPSAQHDKTTINDLGGFLNKVYEIIVTDTSLGETKAFILRYPYKRSHHHIHEESFSSILTRQVAVLRWLERNTFLKTNRVLCHDATGDNPIGTPYMVQEKMPGVNLQDVLAGPGRLGLEQRLALARALGRFFRDLRCITKSRAGTVVASGARPELSNHDPFIAIQPFGARSDGAADAAGDDGGAGPLGRGRLAEPVWLKARDVVLNAFDRRIRQAEASEPVRRGRPDSAHAAGPLLTARGFMERLFRLGLSQDTDDDEFSLWHPDLAPRNMMVDLSLAGGDVLTGVVGWDDPVFAPSFVSCVPPVWLWAPSTHAAHGGDRAVDPREADTEYDLTEPETPDLARVKAVFDREAGEFFVRRAYSRGYIYARALLRWVQLEAWPPPDEAQRRNELLEECRVWLYDNELADSGGPEGGDEGGGAGGVAGGVSETP